jgi:magnesium transporter
MPKFLRKPSFLRIPTFDKPKLGKKESQTAGLPPGTPVYIGEPRTEPVTISCISYSRGHVDELEDMKPGECKQFLGKPEVTWINVNGIHDAKVISDLGTVFNLHPLIVEDIMNTQQRSKMEDFGDSMFLVLKMLDYEDAEKDIKFEQMSVILTKDYILTFQERPGDVFDTIRERIRAGKGRIRGLGTDYLAYALLDAIVDYYYVVLEKVGESIESIEEALMESPEHESLELIYYLKREMIILRKSVWPMREIISRLERSENEIILPETDRYLRDVYDHTIQAIDMVETYRDMLSGMLDLYLSSISNRMNEVMKVLTIIATIFIPLTFIAGIYGMNFDPAAGPLSMPELASPYGYAATLLLMLAISLVMLMFFRKRKWI